jgi:UDP-glucose 4-epimerase
MRTFLTGAGGYIGLHILRELLEHGHQVTAVVRSPGKLGPFARHPQLKIVEADLEDETRIVQVLPGHDVCVHAALIWGDPGSEFEVRDTAIVAKLFDAAGSAGLTRCLYISSVAVHRPFSGEMCEEDCLNATDLYGATKGAGELFLRAACAGHQMTGVVVRPGPVVGPPAFPGGAFRSDDRIAEMVGAAVEGRAIEARRGEGRQFSDVSTVARVVRLLTKTENPHPAYICVDRNIITWERVARLVVGCLNSPSEVHVLLHDTQGLIPRFRTERLEHLNGGPSNAEGALLAHIRHLALTLVDPSIERTR